jgi:hypothetical protein
MSYIVIKISKTISINKTFLYQLEFDKSSTKQNFVLNHEGLIENEVIIFKDKEISDFFKNNEKMPPRIEKCFEKEEKKEKEIPPGIEICFENDKVRASNK